MWCWSSVCSHKAIFNPVWCWSSISTHRDINSPVWCWSNVCLHRAILNPWCWSSVCPHKATLNPLWCCWYSVFPHRATLNPGWYCLLCVPIELLPTQDDVGSVCVPELPWTQDGVVHCTLPQWHAHLSYCNIYLILSSGISSGTGFVPRLECLLDRQYSCVVKYRKYLQRLT